MCATWNSLQSMTCKWKRLNMWRLMYLLLCHEFLLCWHNFNVSYLSERVLSIFLQFVFFLYICCVSGRHWCFIKSCCAAAGLLPLKGKERVNRIPNIIWIISESRLLDVAQLVERRLVIERLLVQCSKRAFRRWVLKTLRSGPCSLLIVVKTSK